MTTILFILAVLFAIPTSGLSLLAFFAFVVVKAVAKGKSRMHLANEVGALRDLENHPAVKQPTWIDTPKEEQFFELVVALSERNGVSKNYVMRGFMSPDSSAVIFSYAANLEERGSSFNEQAMAAAKFVTDTWNEMDEVQRKTFLAKDKSGVLGLFT